jgi:NAD(P)H dehydrogenase (quinone)
MFINNKRYNSLMKHTLVIYAHPTHTGHNGYVLDCVLAQLKQSGTKCVLLDLYEEQFNPVLTFSQEHNAVVDSYQKAVRDASKIIVIYPIWWGGMPAILKGFFDKIFGPKFAYEYRKEFVFGPVRLTSPIGIPRGLLGGRRAVAIVTSGSPAGISWLIMGDRFKPAFCSDIMRFCAIKSKVFHTGGCTSKLEQKKPALHQAVIRALRWLNK